MKNYNDKCGSHIIYVNGRYEGNDDIGPDDERFSPVQAGADRK